MNVESRLFELIGDTAGRLHTGRSRNDQVATDSRMYTKRAAADAVRAVRLTQRALLKQAADHVDTVLPGYTHLQRGQPVSLAHHLLAYFEMLDRDAGTVRSGAGCCRRTAARQRRHGWRPVPARPRIGGRRTRFFGHQRKQHGRRIGPRLHARFRVGLGQSA